MLLLLAAAYLTAVLTVFPLWRIFRRAGLPPVLALMVFLPFGFLLPPPILALAGWREAA